MSVCLQKFYLIYVLIKTHDLIKVREDVAHKHPPNKGVNQNFPQFGDHRLKSEPVLWLHANAAHFIPVNATANLQIRYLPASRNILQPNSIFKK